MPPTASPSPAASSFLAQALSLPRPDTSGRPFRAHPLALLLLVLSTTAPALGAVRPRYGGTLRVEIRSSASSFDPATPDDSPAKAWLCTALFERLISLDDQDRPHPELAAAWQWDGKRWIFRLRTDVRFQDGSALTAADAAASLESLRASAQGDSVVIPGARPIAEFARMRHSIVKRMADSTPVGTGPFRMVNWQPGIRAVLQANLAHWGGRPFLDEIRLEMGRTARDAALEVEVGRADVAELGLSEIRRASKVSQSLPAELLVVLFSPGVSPELREALALSIDRSSIQQVLLQRQGVISAALLPQWLSGYAYLFSAARDLARSRQLARSSPIVIAYDPLDATAKAVTERIAVNAREAGLIVRAGGESVQARLLRIRVTSPDPPLALAGLARSLALPEPPSSGTPAALYAAENDLLRDYRVVPLVHLPDSFALGRQVRNWKVTAWGGWDPADVWLVPEKKP